jgi:phosphoribosylaminoimidazole-succinocarboxamide synthase
MALIQVMMGSKSDAPLIKKKLTDTLKKIGVDFTVSVCSAHRDPDEVKQFTLNGLDRGTEVFICVAGLTNGLAGTVAAHARTSRVIGVPLDREEGVNSILDMPPGVPITLVGVGSTGLTKAAEMACLMLYDEHVEVAAAWDAYLEKLRRDKPPMDDVNIDDLVPREDNAFPNNVMPLFAEGKTKKVFGLGGGMVLIISKDDITAGDGARRDVMADKALHATTTTCNVFELLEREGVPTHYLGRAADTAFLARRVDMIPIEVVMRGTAFGSYLKRNPDAVEGQSFDEVLVEFFLKDDANHDPLMVVNDGVVELHTASVPVGDDPLGEADGVAADFLLNYQEEFESIGRRVFDTIAAAWIDLGHKLVDLKIEFGFDAEKGELLVADVIDNDSWRVWLNGDPKQQVDKQVYRDHGLAEPGVAMRIKGNYALVARLTEQFVPALVR